MLHPYLSSPDLLSFGESSRQNLSTHHLTSTYYNVTSDAGIEVLKRRLQARQNHSQLSLSLKLSDPGADALVQFLTQNPLPGLYALTIIPGGHLSGQSLCSILVALRTRCTSLQTLDLSRNSMKPDVLACLAQSLPFFPRLSILTLSGHPIPSLQNLCSALQYQSSSSLRVLNLNNNSINDHGISDLCAAIWSGGLPRLEELLLARNKLTVIGYHHLSSVLFQHALGPLRVLDLQESGIHAQELAPLAQAFKSGSCPNLATLKLSGNRLGLAGARVLFPCLLGCPQLKELEVNHSDFREKGVEVLAEAMTVPGWPALTRLDLSYIGMGEGGATTLFNAVVKTEAWECMVSLSVAGNSMGASGALALSEMLREGRFPLLEELDVHDNYLQDHGIGCLATTAIHLPSKLKTLDTSFNCITDQGATVLAQSISVGGLNLHALDMEGNLMTPKGIRDLRGAFKENRQGLTFPSWSLNVDRNQPKAEDNNDGSRKDYGMELCKEHAYGRASLLFSN